MEKFKKDNKRVWLSIGTLILLTLIIGFLYGLKAIALSFGLMMLGLISFIFIAFTGIHFGQEFTLFAGLTLAYYYHPLIGALIIALEYALLWNMLPKDMVANDIPVAGWFIIVILFIFPQLPFDRVLVNIMIATIIGEAGNKIWWTFQGFPSVFNGILKVILYFFLFSLVVIK